MKIGIPKERKKAENRAGATPANVQMLVENNHTVLVEEGAGEGIGISDKNYENAGAEIKSDPADVWDSDMVIKIKEPLKEEFQYLHEGLLLFTFLHLANPNLKNLTIELRDKGVTAIGYETVEKLEGTLPLLRPMSEIAGKLSMQTAAHLLQKHKGGKGLLIGGTLGTNAGNVTVIGAGTVGSAAAKTALGMGADVRLLDISIQSLKEFVNSVGFSYPGNLTCLKSNNQNLRDSLEKADIMIGAVLVPGAQAPKIVTRDMVKSMEEKSVLADVSIDQGGCCETSKPTTHSNPTYIEEGILHFCVTNIPGAVPVTSTNALTNLTTPYALEIANKGFEKALKDNIELKKGLNTYKGYITHKEVSKAHNLEYKSFDDI